MTTPTPTPKGTTNDSNNGGCKVNTNNGGFSCNTKQNKKKGGNSKGSGKNNATNKGNGSSGAQTDGFPLNQQDNATCRPIQEINQMCTDLCK